MSKKRDEQEGSVKTQGISRRNLLKYSSLAALGAVGASSLVGCGEADSGAGSKEGTGAFMKPGEYTGKALGHKGLFELPVTIAVNEHSILRIAVPEDHFEHGETTPILQSVQDRLFPRIIEQQSLDVDAITGATSSSLTAKAAIENALKEALIAGGSSESDVEYFHKQPNFNEEGIVEEVDVDVLLVGLSIGGCFALKSSTEELQRLNDGGRVSLMAIDRAGKVGGRSSLTHMIQSVNPSYAVNNWNNGQEYIDADEYYNYWLEWVSDESGVPMASAEVIRSFIDESGKTLDWQLENGWHVGSHADDEGPQNGAVCFHTNPAPGSPGTFEDRRIIVDGYLRQFVEGAVGQGARVELETEAYELMYDAGNSTVTGAKARNIATGKEYIINAKAVVMGTGGFGNNADMMTEYLDPRWAGPHPFLGTGTDTGLMIQSAIDIGAGTRNIEMSPLVMHVGLPHFLDKYPINIDETKLNNFTGRYSTWTINDAPLGLGLCGDQLAVSPEGKRFTDEDRMMKLFTDNVKISSWPSYQCGSHYYSIWSKDQLEEIAQNGFTTISRWEVYQSQGGVPDETPIPEIFECLDRCVEEKMAWKADSIEDLATQLDIDPAVLGNTVDQYNDACAQGVDGEYGKEAALLKPVESGPYYAIKLMNVIFATVGGLSVDSEVRVLQSDDTTPIKGFYAYGCDSLGNLLNPEQNYTVFPAVAAGWNQTGGRLAAVNAVKYVHETYGLTEVSMQALPEGMQQ